MKEYIIYPSVVQPGLNAKNDVFAVSIFHLCSVIRYIDIRTYSIDWKHRKDCLESLAAKISGNSFNENLDIYTEPTYKYIDIISRETGITMIRCGFTILNI